MTLELALDLLKKKSDDAPVAQDPVTGRQIYLKIGRFGAYFELEQTEEEKESKVKPQRVSLPRDVKADDVTPEIAQKLISLPRTLGPHPDDNEDVVATLGRYGPYVKWGKESRSLGTWQEACEIGLERALEVLKQPKKRGRNQKVVLKELGELEGAEGPVQVIDGRYGPYVSDGTTNATIPRGSDPMAVTAEQAQELLEGAEEGAEKEATRSQEKEIAFEPTPAPCEIEKTGRLGRFFRAREKRGSVLNKPTRPIVLEIVGVIVCYLYNTPTRCAGHWDHVETREHRQNL